MSNLRSLVFIDALTDSDIQSLFKKTAEFKAQKHQAERSAGPGVVLAFFEPSTRTQLSFERALQRMGWQYSVADTKHLSVQKGESLDDTFDNLYACGFRLAIIRHSESDLFHCLRASPMRFINAGSGSFEHPTQGLLDCFTLYERWGSLKGKKLVIVGDVLHSRVARSTGKLALRLGAQVTLCGPIHWVSKDWKELGFQVEHQLEAALETADAVMALRAQHERHGSGEAASYPKTYTLSAHQLELLPQKPLLLHPGPVRWNEEITSDVQNYDHQLILSQTENGLFVRQAVLEWCLS